MPKSESAVRESKLVLGWEVTPTLDPRYWVENRRPKPGGQSWEDLVEIPAKYADTHTAIIAQSGSGKSFFLGRLIEEILLRTRARCLVLDPNADFRRVHEVEEADLWKKAAYNMSNRSARLPHEFTRSEFESKWSKVDVVIRAGPGLTGKNYERLRLSWPELDIAFFAEEIESIQRSDLYHCHNFVKALDELLRFKYLPNSQNFDLISLAKKAFRQIRGLEKVDLREALEQEYDSVHHLTGKSSRMLKPVRRGDLVYTEVKKYPPASLHHEVAQFIEIALTVEDCVSPTIERFYFGKAEQYQKAGILQLETQAGPWAPARFNRLEVVDLPSLPDKNIRQLAINALLTEEWEQARKHWEFALKETREPDWRVPTFIVLDEAHNLIPKETQSHAELAIRDQFRTIVAEGRKYGLFVILASQRPDKLDPLVLSECENKVVMRLGSPKVLDITKEMLGLDGISQRLIDKCLEFEVGRAMLVGRWAPGGPRMLYCAARRTVEGGRNLKASSWAVPPGGKGARIVKRRKTKPVKTKKRS